MKGSGYCSIVGEFRSIRCSKTNVLTKHLLDSSPRLRLIDGKGPAEYQSPDGGPRPSWKEDTGFFVVALAAGKHKLALSYHVNSADLTAVVTGPVEEVEIEAVARHSYEIHAIEGNKGWIIYDVTDKAQRTATVIMGGVSATFSLK